MLDLTQCYRITSSDITCEDFDGEKVILNLATGQYFSLNDAAGALMDGLLHSCDLGSLCSVPSAAFAVADAIAFFECLASHDLIRIDSATAPASIPALIAARITALTAQPLIEAYNDLADLIIGDPVHETDEAVGWPTRKAA